ncbi:hypothetical protein FHR84_000963 [Actinopolyspora biskrensis]|uniref:DUF2218 domain-containing protein n=1 Tax=Actinopolyspora biskrensis TaxID=1470178 RepID=A0A852YVR8_9ACTN|nr:DUF2218 domain-containing protein [Actinopolyspora biskrensis]NYH77649.1 hypothetical protein [Actinopolyspora biskrensis]
MPQAHAEVRTQRAQRYLKQLASHLGERCEITEETDSTRITLPRDRGTGHCLLTPHAETLTMHAEADTTDDLASVQDVIGRHLERFGERDGLTVAWSAEQPQQ